MWLTCGIQDKHEGGGIEANATQNMLRTWFQLNWVGLRSHKEDLRVACVGSRSHDSIIHIFRVCVHTKNMPTAFKKGSFVDGVIINSSSLFLNSGGFMSSHIRSAANFVY